MNNICFLFETYYVGGLDTYIYQLINDWPNNDDIITLYYNGNYEEIKYIKSHITRKNVICIPYTMSTSYPLRKKISQLFGHGKLYWIVSFFIVYGLLLYYIIFSFIKLNLSKYDSLMVINGGYPGSNVCRGVAISWHLYTGGKSVHNFHNYAMLSSNTQMILENIIDKLLLKSTEYFVSVSKSCTSSILNRPSFKSINNYKYIYNGISDEINAKKMDIRQKYNLPGNSVLGLILATYEERKGHDFLFKVVQYILNCNIDNFYIVCCGFGEQEDIDRIKTLLKKYKIGDHVILESFVQNSNDYIVSSDILLISSQEFESFGLTAIEGMKYKRPIVSTNVGGLKEVINNGNGGYTFDRDDIEGYANKIIELINSPTLREEQGNLGYKRFVKYFTSSRMCQEYSDLIHGKLQ